MINLKQGFTTLFINATIFFVVLIMGVGFYLNSHKSQSPVASWGIFPVSTSTAGNIVPKNNVPNTTPANTPSTNSPSEDVADWTVPMNISNIVSKPKPPILTPNTSAQNLPSIPGSTSPSVSKLCGDGVCGPIEKANPSICPADCGGALPTGGQSKPPVGGVKPQSGASGNYNLISNIEYANISGTSLALDLYTPKTTSAGKYPVIIEIHGGAFKAGDKYPSQMAASFVAQGYVVAAVNYRLSDVAPFPAAIQDVKGAVRYLRAKADTYNLDVNHFGTMGASAGGSLAALLGMSCSVSDLEGTVGGNTDKSSCVQAVVDMFGPVDFYNLQAQRASHGFNASDVEAPYLNCAADYQCAAAKTASAVTYIDSFDPPTYILHGELDNQIPPDQSQNFYDDLISAGVVAQFQIVAGAGHGGPQFSNYIPQMVSFFNKYLKS